MVGIAGEGNATKGELRFGWRGRIGMILPSANRVAEPELMDLLPAGISLHTTRIKLAGTSPAELLASTEKVEEAAALLADNAPDLIAFHCTAVSTYDADLEESLKRRIAKAAGRPAIATSDALIAAFAVLGARKVVMLSPYPQALNDREVAFLGRHGIAVLRERGLDLPVTEHADVPPEEWRRQLAAIAHPDADAYFLGCTNIRAVPAIAAMERDLGRPVVSSNQAILWHALRSNGMADRLPGYGRLLASH
jgi:maleate isomerase